MHTPPTMTPLVSSNIAAVGHDGDALWVQFKGGGLYRYPDASADHHKAMVAAQSPGSYFHQRVKGFHSGERIG